MSLSIGVNLRVTGHCNQGGRRYMEDMFRVAYQRSSDGKDLECAFFGIFDGHGGGEAAVFAKEHLMDIIIKQKNFWSDKDEDVLRAIRDGYVNTHYAMWRELDKWPRTASGFKSTAGTTASVAFIRKGKIYIGHVGDSGIILGYEEKGFDQWWAKPLTRDHKPESDPEMTRIQESGGKVVTKSGVPRVVWNRPRIGHKGPVRRSTLIDEIPFLAVARSLGDLWSYNSELDTFVVSPEPDVKVVTIDVSTHRCLIFGTDGLWNMLSPQSAVSIVQAAERHNEKHLIASQQAGNGQSDTQMWINPSKSLVDRALYKWSMTRLRADNTSVVTLMLDPPTPSRGEALVCQKKEVSSATKMPPPEKVSVDSTAPLEPIPVPRVVVTPKEPDSSISSTPDTSEPEPAPSADLDESTQCCESIQVAEVSSSEDQEPLPTNLTPETDPEPSQDPEPSHSSVACGATNPLIAENKASRLRRSAVTKETVNGVKRKRDDKRAIFAMMKRDVDGATVTKRAKRVTSKSHENLAQPDGGAFGGARLRRETRSLPGNAGRNGDSEEARLAVNGKEVESFFKRRTRSEVQTEAADENDPTNQKLQEPCKRLKWPAADSGAEVGTATKVGPDRKLSSPTSFQRRNLEKKVSPAKGVRRASLNESNRLLRLNVNHDASRQNRVAQQRVAPGHRAVLSYDGYDAQRWLRSDTIAATSMKTLRSRNVDSSGHTIPAQIASRYDCIKHNRASLPARLRGATLATPPAGKSAGCASQPAATATVKSKLMNGLPPSGGATSSPSVASAPMIKRTRSRFKRLGK